LINDAESGVNMTSTENMLQNLETIKEKINGLRIKDKQLDDKFLSKTQELDCVYRKKLCELEAEKNSEIAKATFHRGGVEREIKEARRKLDDIEEAFHANERELDRSCQKKIQQLKSEMNKKLAQAESQRHATLDRIGEARQLLSEYEGSLPEKYRAQLRQKAAPRAAQKLDFNDSIDKIDAFIRKITDETFLAKIKKLLKIGGYAGQKQMIEELGIEIGQGYALLTGAEQKCKEVFAQQKREAEGSFSTDKDKVEKKRKEFHRQILQERNEASLNSMKIFTELKLTLEQGCAFLKDEERKCQEFFLQRKKEAETRFAADKAENDGQRSDFHSKIKQKYDAGTADLLAEVERLPDEQTVRDFVSFRESALQSVDWTQYEPAVACPDELLLGRIDAKLELPPPLDKILKSTLPFANGAGHVKNIDLPLASSLYAPLKLYIAYSDGAKKTVMSGVQSIVMRLLKYLPLRLFSITNIDPKDRGTNLGDLHTVLSRVSSLEIYKASLSGEAILKSLQELENFVDETCVKLGGLDSIYQYNSGAQENEAPIKRHFLIINDYPYNFDRRSEDILGRLLNNADKCGISFIFTSEKGRSEEIPEVVRNNFLRLEAEDDNITAHLSRGAYKFVFDDASKDSKKFLGKFKQVCEEGAKVDNNFFKYFDLRQPPVYLTKPSDYRDATNGLRIPFALDEWGEMISLDLGIETNIHAFLSGTTGAGKSRTLQSIINSIIMRYHPDDVELWLADYGKVAFNFYVKNSPPHVKVVAVENSSEFTFAFLEMLFGEYNRRIDLFKRESVENIAGYREKRGPLSLPRIVVFVDEFKLMTQHVGEVDTIRTLLGNILTLGRKAGISCFFCSQLASAGLKGLPEDGLRSINVRLAMRDEIGEIKETLKLGPGYQEKLNVLLKTMKVGDIAFERIVEDKLALKVYRCLLMPDDGPVKVAQYSNDYLPDYRRKELIVVDGTVRRPFDSDEIDRFEVEHPSTGIPLYIGTPTTMKPCFAFSLEKTESNIMLVGRDDDVRASILYHILYCFKRRNNSRVVIYASKSEKILREHRKILLNVCNEVRTGVEEISKTLFDYPEIFDYSQKNPDEAVRPTLHVWLGLEKLADEIENKKLRSLDSVKKSLETNIPLSNDNVLRELAEGLPPNMKAYYDEHGGSLSFEDEEQITEPVAQEANKAFDFLPIIGKMITEGGEIEDYTLVTYNSVETATKVRAIRKESFMHKIALHMENSILRDFLNSYRLTVDLEKEDPHSTPKTVASAVYYCEGTAVKFRPYLLPELE
jgi:hypothetical protein